MILFSKKTSEGITDHRRFERLKPEDLFFVEFQKNEHEKIRLGQGKDLSQGGIRFATSAPVKKGDRLKMTLYLPKLFPGRRKIESSAQVRRIHDLGGTHRLRVACEFLAPDPSAQEAIHSYLDWAKTESLTPA